MGAGRGVASDRVDGRIPGHLLNRIMNNRRYTIRSLYIDSDITVFDPLPSSLRKLFVNTNAYGPLPLLPKNLVELIIEEYTVEQPLVLPPTLQKLNFYSSSNHPIILPPSIIEVDIGGDYLHPIGPLPEGLKHLAFHTWGEFDHPPITLPSTIIRVHFGDGYNHPTILPTGIKDVQVGLSFSHDMWFPDSVKKLAWDCDRLAQLPEGLIELDLGDSFNQTITFPASLKKLNFLGALDGPTYTHKLKFPPGLEELSCSRRFEEFTIPEGIRKLTWSSTSYEGQLPSSLRELKLTSMALLPLPEGLVKLDLIRGTRLHVDLPESVEHLTCTCEHTFTHPSVLRHLTVRGWGEVDVSSYKIDKVTIEAGVARLTIKSLPRNLKELEFMPLYGGEEQQSISGTVHVPRGCKVIGRGMKVNLSFE